MRDEPPPKEKDIKYELITNDTIYNCIAAPHPADIRLIMTTLMNTPNVTSCLSTINTLKASRGLALADILTALAEALQTLEVPPQTRVLWLEGLAEIEFRLAGGVSENVQTGGMVGILRQGVELLVDKGMIVEED
jgi:replication factor C subunit 3/5